MWNIELSKAQLNNRLQDAPHRIIGSVLGLAGRGQNDQYTPPPPNVQGMNRTNRVKLATQSIPQDEATEFIKRYAVAVLNELEDRSDIPDWLEEVINDFRENGWALDRTEGESKDPWSSKKSYSWSVSALGHEETPLKDLTTKLEELLTDNNLAVAAGHYSQACRNFETKDWAAANAQLRTTLESSLLEITKKQGPWNGSKGGDAIDLLKVRGHLTENESKYFTGLWSLSHASGSHPGLSDEVESQFRMYSVTAGIYYLVNRLT